MRAPGIFWWPGSIPAGTTSHLVSPRNTRHLRSQYDSFQNDTNNMNSLGHRKQRKLQLLITSNKLQSSMVTCPSLLAQVWTQMDLFSTVAELAGVKPPTDRIYDGLPLARALRFPQLEISRQVLIKSPSKRLKLLLSVAEMRQTYSAYSKFPFPSSFLRVNSCLPIFCLLSLTFSFPSLTSFLLRLVFFVSFPQALVPLSLLFPFTLANFLSHVIPIQAFFLLTSIHTKHFL